ncbi:MAG: hypothetical protein RL707_1928, partial [Pseudomonadota bacterium]
MQMRRLCFSHWVKLAAAGLCAFSVVAAHAQTYPYKP